MSAIALLAGGIVAYVRTWRVPKLIDPYAGAPSIAYIDTDIDWLACEPIEQIPGKVSGRPIMRGTRIMPDPIVNSYDLGDTMEEIHEGFPALSVAQIKRLIEFPHAQRAQLQP